jgi:hypothetical protein
MLIKKWAEFLAKGDIDRASRDSTGERVGDERERSTTASQ